jgi:flagellar basal-body rod modification protein FlgD
MSLASVAAAQQAATQQTGSTSGTGTSSSATSNAMGSLSGNFQTFLTLLMTQLKNQDPTSPLDTNEFTSQLVQFASVEQQINTNTSLTQLITLTQDKEVVDASAMVGSTVLVNADHMPLQSSTGAVAFTAGAAGTATISITTDAGTKIMDATVTASEGKNVWNWNGKNAAGATMPDGSYAITVTGSDASGKTAALPFQVAGTVTGVEKSGSTTLLQLGSQTAAVSSVQSVMK